MALILTLKIGWSGFMYTIIEHYLCGGGCKVSIEIKKKTKIFFLKLRWEISDLVVYGKSDTSSGRIVNVPFSSHPYATE